MLDISVDLDVESEAAKPQIEEMSLVLGSFCELFIDRPTSPDF